MICYFSRFCGLAGWLGPVHRVTYAAASSWRIRWAGLCKAISPHLEAGAGGRHLLFSSKWSQGPRGWRNRLSLGGEVRPGIHFSYCLCIGGGASWPGAAHHTCLRFVAEIGAEGCLPCSRQESTRLKVCRGARKRIPGIMEERSFCPVEKHR